MKKKIILAFLLITFSVVVYLLVLIVNKSKEKRQLEQARIDLPAFEFLDLKGAVFKKEHLDFHQATVVIHYNPDCDYCQHEAKDIQAHLVDFEEINLLMVSSASSVEIKTFAKANQLLGRKQVRLLQDEKESFYTLFGVKGVPSIFIYDANQKLVKFFKGETKIETILRQIEEQKLL